MNIRIYLSLILFILILSPGCLESHNHKSKEEQIYLKYDLEIMVPNNFNFTLFLPAYKNKNGSYMSINNDFEIIYGSLEINKIGTIYGEAIEVKSNESFKIKLEKTYDYRSIQDFSGLSLANYNNTSNHFEGYWVYYLSEKSNQTVVLNMIEEEKYSLSWSHSFRRFNSTSELKNGWQVIKGHLESICYDKKS